MCAGAYGDRWSGLRDAHARQVVVATAVPEWVSTNWKAGFQAVLTGGVSARCLLDTLGALARTPLRATWLPASATASSPSQAGGRQRSPGYGHSGTNTRAPSRSTALTLVQARGADGPSSSCRTSSTTGAEAQMRGDQPGVAQHSARIRQGNCAANADHRLMPPGAGPPAALQPADLQFAVRLDWMNRRGIRDFGRRLSPVDFLGDLLFGPAEYQVQRRAARRIAPRGPPVRRRAPSGMPSGHRVLLLRELRAA